MYKFMIKKRLLILIALLTFTPLTNAKAYDIGLGINIDSSKTDNSNKTTFNTTISKINHSNGLNIVMMQKDKNNCYYFVTDDNIWSAGEMVTITIDSNEMVTNAVPYISKRDKYKLGDNGVTYVNQLVTNDDLKTYAINWLKDNYNITLDIPITFNSIRQDSNDYIVYGQTLYKNNTPTEIVISSDLNNTKNDTNIITERMLIHELTHYVLAKKGLEYKDGTNNFTNEALKNGATIDSKDNDMGILHSHVAVNQIL